MFIEAKKLIGLPVAALESQAKIGEIREIIVDPENGRLLGFLVASGGLLSAKKALAIVDVRDFDPNGIVTASADNLVEPQEIVRINEVLVNKLFLIGKSAKTEAGKNLGVVEDLLVDTETQSVAKYYLKDLLGNARILTADKVVKIDKVIIFSDEVAEPPPGAVGAPAAWLIWKTISPKKF